MDIFSYGYGDKFRREWMKTLVGDPSREDAEIDFALGGGDFRGDTGRARRIGDVPVNVFSQALSAHRELLADPGAAEELGRRARERVFDEHTYAHRARQILDLVGLSVPVGVRG